MRTEKNIIKRCLNYPKGIKNSQNKTIFAGWKSEYLAQPISWGIPPRLQIKYMIWELVLRQLKTMLQDRIQVSSCPLSPQHLMRIRYQQPLGKWAVSISVICQLLPKQ